MRKIPPSRYQRPNEVDRQIKEKQSMADGLPAGDRRQKLLIEIARLKTYADMKRWIGSEAAVQGFLPTIENDSTPIKAKSG
jgi:hypothetical protein